MYGESDELAALKKTIVVDRLAHGVQGIVADGALGKAAGRRHCAWRDECFGIRGEG